MAEFVEKNMQDMVGEVEEMERLNLLSSDEIKKLIEKRRNLEYKVYGMRKEKQNYFNSVMYDIQLLDLIDVRRKKMMMFECFEYIEKPIVLRVKIRLRMMTRIWPSHADVWQLRISFAKSRKHFDQVSAAYSEQIQFHGDNENVWIAWAQWEMEGRGNFENARSILLSRAPLYHPNSLCLAREYFRLELLYVEYLNKKSKSTNIEGLEEITAENRDKVLKCGIAEKVYENSQANFSCPKLYLEFHSVAKKFEFASALRDRIIRDLLTNFPNDPAVWKLKASLVIEGHSLACFTDEETDHDLDKQIQISQDPIVKLKKMTSLYDRAMSSIGPSFIDCVIQDYFKILDEIWSAKNLVKNLLLALLKIFKSNVEHLKPLHFMIWFEVASLMKKPKIVLKNIVRQATAQHPKSPYIKLKFYQTTAPKLTFKEKMNLVDELHGEFGAEMSLWLAGRSKPNNRLKLFKRIFSHPDRVLCKSVRLSHLYSLNDTKECRAHYLKYATSPPYDLEFHTAMLTKELKSREQSIEICRRIFENAVDQFGSSEVGLWLAYAECEKKFGSLKKKLEIVNRSTSVLKSEYLPRLTDFKFAVEAQLKKSNSSPQQTEYFVDFSEEKKLTTPIFMQNSTVPCFFDSSLHLEMSNLDEKCEFFCRLAEVEKKCSTKDGSSLAKINNSELWEKVLSLICGETVYFTLKKLPANSKSSSEHAKDFVQRSEVNFASMLDKKDVKLSDGLQKQEIVFGGKTVKDDVAAALSASSVLKPDFQTQKDLAPFFRSRNAVKKDRRVARSKTAGTGWFNMQSTVSDETKRDMKLLKMRSVMDPKRHYKRSDMKETPKFFQMGKVVDSPTDFYSSRIPNKLRKATMVEEIMNDERVMQHQKKKYKEIFEKREARKKRMMRSQKGRKRKVKKLSSGNE